MIPIKKPKGRKLLELEKASNRRLARKRVAMEHVNRTVKTFSIFKDFYRNRRRRPPYLNNSLLCYHNKLTIQKI
ncbi:MAG: hypothetical protein LBI18_11275 [Planctomycetaceae bacterium]|nr:hypothetical protein [Planctomycetaceae bacterium]